MRNELEHVMYIYCNPLSHQKKGAYLYMELLKEYEDIAEDLNDQHIKTYIQFKMLHLETFKKEIQNIKSFLIKENIPDDYKEFLKKLYAYEKKHQYKYKQPGYKAIAGIRIEVILPRKMKSITDQKKFAVNFMKQCNPIGYEIPWISYILTRREANYMIFLISEREYINAESIELYNRNYIGKDGRLIHKKNDPKLDAAGNPKKKHVLFSKKVRLFTFSRFRGFENFCKDLIEKIMIALDPIIKKIAKRFTLKKKNAKRTWHFYNGKCVIEVNHAKRFIETMCNHALALQRAKVETSFDEYRMKTSPTPLAQEISNLFYQNKKRFDKSEFHDHEGLVREINYKNVSLDVLQENLTILLEQFKKDLINIVPEALN